MTPEIDHIKDCLRRCKTIPEVNSTAVHFARQVSELELSKNRDDRTMAIQIKNLATVMRSEIKRNSK